MFLQELALCVFVCVCLSLAPSRLCLTSQLSGPSPGVAEQFAITEARSSLNEEELSSRGGSQVIQLQGTAPDLCPRTGASLLSVPWLRLPF